MGIERMFGEELLVVGVLRSASIGEEAPLESLRRLFGGIRERSPEELFLWTQYYDKEMGTPIYRSYVLMDAPADPSTLAECKRRCDREEIATQADGRRRMNLDPGMLAPGRFSLATTKDRAHRIPLDGGIYAELTLIYEKGEFRALPWTYPDWASEPVRRLLGRWRRHLFDRS